MGPQLVDRPSLPEVSWSARNSRSSAIRDLLAVVRRGDVVSLAGGLPDPATLPLGELSSSFAAVLDDPSVLQYGPTEGEPALREHIADHELGGVDPAEVLVTTGAQQALQLLVDVLVDPGDRVLVEHRSYVGMLQPLRRAGARVDPVDGDADGIATLELATSLRSGARRTKLLYLAPTFQNPSGSVLSTTRRGHVARLAHQHGVVVIDDDPYRALAFEPPPPRLREFVHPDLAVTVGSFSKSVAPGLRVGWVHAPQWLIGPLVRAKQSADLHTGTLDQRLLLALLADEAAVASRRAERIESCRHRAAVLRDRLDELLGDRIALSPVRGGMFMWADFPGLPVDADALARAALDEGVAIVAGSAFDPLERPSGGARLCFATLDDAALELAAERLARAVERAWHDPGVEVAS